MRAVAAGVLTLVLAALAAVSLAPRADAAFSLGKCGGVEITGRGASFARDAHGVFNNYFQTSVCPGGSLDVVYEPLGSGAGKESMRRRDLPPRFGMSDEPPSPLEVLRINRGVPGINDDPNDTTNPSVINTDDDGTVHVIPAAVGAVAPLVNLPSGCTQTEINAIPTTSTSPVSRTVEQDRTDDGVPDGVVRLRFRKDVFEEIWAQGATAPSGEEVEYLEWGDVVPAFDGVANCGNKPIIRVVRFDESGTSFAFKDYLSTILTGRAWKTAWSTVEPGLTRNWPGATFGARTDCNGNPNGPGGGATQDTDNLTSACSNNAANLVEKLKATDGSIGYADISTARAAGLEVTPRVNAGSSFDNDTYWTQIENGSDTYTEPTANAFGFRQDGAKGANCTSTTFQNVPNTTLESWFTTSGVNSPEGFGICTLTYGLVFDDNAEVWPNNTGEEAKARTVKDYWTGIVTDAAQSLLPISDYAPLPDDIQAIAAAGVASVGWDKASGGGGPEGGGDDNGGGGNNDGGAPLPLGPPSSKFSLLRKSVSSKTGGATISVKVPGAGKLEMVGTAKVGKKTIRVGRTVLNANKAGTFKLGLKPSAAAKKQLRKKGSLRVSLKLTFTPTGGSASTSTAGLTLKLGKKGK